MSSNFVKRKSQKLIPSTQGTISLDKFLEEFQVHEDNRKYFNNITDYLLVMGDNNIVYKQSVFRDLMEIAQTDPKDVKLYEEIFCEYTKSLRGKPIKPLEDFFSEIYLCLYLSTTKDVADKYFKNGLYVKAEKQTLPIMKALQANGIFSYERYLQDKDLILEIKPEDVFLHQLHIDSRENSKLFDIIEKYKDYDYDYKYIANKILPNKFKSINSNLHTLMSIVDFNKIILDKTRYKLREKDDHTLIIPLEDPRDLTLADILPPLLFKNYVYEKILENKEGDYFKLNDKTMSIEEYFSQEMKEVWQYKLVDSFLEQKIASNLSKPQTIEKCQKMKKAIQKHLLDITLEDKNQEQMKNKSKI